MKHFVAAASVLLTSLASAAEPGPLSGVWKNEQDGFIVRIEHNGNMVRATLLADQQYPGSNLWQLGEVDFEGTWDGSAISDARERLVWTREVETKCPSIARTKWVDMRLTRITPAYVMPGGVVMPGRERLEGSIQRAGLLNGQCRLGPPRESPWSYVRVQRSVEYKFAQYLPTQPLDEVAFDCTPGKLIDPDSTTVREIWNALARVERQPVAPVIRAPDEYLVFIATDGTGNHDREHISPGTHDAPDQCRGSRNESIMHNRLTATQLKSNVALLHDHVKKHNNIGKRLIPVYVRGVGTGAKTRGIMRGFESSGVSDVTLVDFERVVNEALAKVKDGVTQAYRTNPAARFVFVTAGFSRGAAAARRINNRLIEEGIRNKDDPGEYIVRPKDVRIGATVLYDTVVSLDTGAGTDPYLASKAFNIPDGVQGLHIVAKNEYRNAFPLTSAGARLMHQVWVPGAHSDIGGTYTTDGISAVTLKMGLYYLHKAGISVGDPMNHFGLNPSQRPNDKRFVIHDSRYMAADQPFDDMLRDVKRTLDPKYDPTYRE